MKTMGLRDLCLVNPRNYQTDKEKAEASRMATGAADLLLHAKSFSNILEAIQDCTVVIASTARSRDYDLPLLSPEESANKLYQAAQDQKVALLFGPERMGLSNEDLQLAKYRATIPTSPDYSSLNLAAAVQTFCYEIYKCSQVTKHAEQKSNPDINPLPDVKSMEQFYVHLEETLSDTDFIIKNHPGEIMQKLRAIYDRAELDESELNIMRGILSSVNRYRENIEK